MAIKSLNNGYVLITSYDGKVTDKRNRMVHSEVICKEGHKGNFSYKEIEPSDKSGYNWITTYLGDAVITREYVKGIDASGTSSATAIPFVLGMSITPNTYYSYDGKTYVYMGVATDNAVWSQVAEMMADWHD